MWTLGVREGEARLRVCRQGRLPLEAFSTGQRTRHRVPAKARLFGSVGGDLELWFQGYWGSGNPSVHALAAGHTLCSVVPGRQLSISSEPGSGLFERVLRLQGRGRG